MKHLLTLLFTLSILSTIQGQDVFEIKFSVGLTRYRCALAIFDNGTGLMRVKYYDNGTQLIEESMHIEITELGLVLTGYNPVYAGTNVKALSYSADNFYLYIDEYGNYNIVNIDNNGITAQVYIRTIKGKRKTNDFLRDFNWKL